ncbi:mixed lineage kinase domain-like protein [Bombina bombina]|uniref:mixed lineage kinase domain-like protein n=1 Tax=Bombina bombina TaxID=8345 RepID=UPI00235B25FB|nr:mixed lineage kinase domain-like protein [Bombina bombina]
MEVVETVFSIAQKIYALCDQATSNKEQCTRLKKRIEILLIPVDKLKSQNDKSKELKKVGGELQLTLKNAISWVKKYSKQEWWKKILKANKIKEEFDLINDRLGDAAEAISLLLAVEKREKFLNYFNEKKRKKQNQEALQKDFEYLKQYLSSEIKPLADRVDHLNDGIQDIIEKVDKLRVCFQRTPWEDTSVINPSDLKRGELLIEKPGHNTYKGEYHRTPVAIKVLKGDLVQDDAIVRTTFNTEIKMMKKFECLNILRLYGICIDNSNGGPHYSMVMELCEKGTLQELLTREPNLSWEQRVRMSLDAARALYRLHHTEEKAILHGCLSSHRFLVNDSYYLKLAGFELSKTESSMRKTPNANKRNENTDLAYIAPEALKSITAYNKSSEIYSLGVVLWEIASGLVPLQSFAQTVLSLPIHTASMTLEGTEASRHAETDQYNKNFTDLYQKQFEEMEAAIPVDCPAFLRDIIKSSQAMDPNDRPIAGVIVDLLMDHLNKHEN